MVKLDVTAITIVVRLYNAFSVVLIISILNIFPQLSSADFFVALATTKKKAAGYIIRA